MQSMYVCVCMWGEGRGGEGRERERERERKGGGGVCSKIKKNEMKLNEEGNEGEIKHNRSVYIYNAL